MITVSEDSSTPRQLPYVKDKTVGQYLADLDITVSPNQYIENGRNSDRLELSTVPADKTIICIGEEKPGN